MKELKDFYEKQVTEYEELVKEDKRKLSLISGLRIGIFLVTAGLIYVFYPNSNIVGAIALLGIIFFIFLLKIHESRKSEYRLHLELQFINEEELRILDWDYLKRFDGKGFEDPNHYYSSDIDLFGRGSLFQYINRTGLKEGAELLAAYMKANVVTNINERQKAIKELSKNTEWRQNYTALARLIKAETSTVTISNWLTGYTSFIPRYFKWIPAVFGGFSVVLISGAVLEFLNPQIAFFWFIFGLFITAGFVRKINHLNANTSKMRETVQQYALLLREIESQDFSSRVLLNEKEKIKTKESDASTIFTKFSKALDALDNRNNLLVAVLGNGFFLWDILCSYRIEKWMNSYGSLVYQWFRAVAFFDAYNSMATFAHNHPNNVYPDVNLQRDISIKAIGLGHPLIPDLDRVCSDLEMKNSDFLIITGANMAGKSTFLRSVSFLVVMANMGLPVCAESCQYAPIKLITSMRTSDSLTDNSSYFFAELTRLQFIMEQLPNDSYLVVLDEILKGTNSVDKTEGSKKLIEKLVNMGVSGIIATHDLSLCSMEEEIEEVKNYFFETEIKNDELKFDYQLKEGICKNMNASFLLQKMKIT